MAEIFIEKTDDRIGFVKKVLRKFRPEFKGKKVFVKPNLVSFEPYPTTTHPDVLAEVLRTLLRAGCKVLVGAGPAPDAGDSEPIIQNHPLKEVCSDLGIELLNMHKMPFKKMDGLRVSEVPLKCNYIISLPVLKCHGSCQITGALKNQFSFLHNKERMAMHARIKNIHRGIAHLNQIFKVNLFIVDAIQTYSVTNEKRHGGIEAELGYMLAGQNPVALDCAGLELLKKIEPKLRGKRPEDIQHIKWAIQLGV